MRGQPGAVRCAQPLQVCPASTVAAPLRDELVGGPRAAKTVRGQQEEVVVAQDRADVAANRLRLVLQAHDQIKDADAVRPAIRKVTHEIERRPAAAPAPAVIHQPCPAQDTLKRPHAAMHVADDVDALAHSRD